MPQKILIDKLEFYITNVCNLTCNGCNRYNNYKFSGWQSWEEAEPILKRWAEKIDIQHPVILGGEPLLNPDIVKWIQGVRKLWPNHGGVQVQSNGTRIDCVNDLAAALNPDSGNWLGISIHNPADREEIFTRIRNFLGPTVIETQRQDEPTSSDYQFTNESGIRIHAWMSDKFVQSNIIELPDNKYTLYQSDPARAHENCAFRKFKNYHMIRGKIYKCGPAALMPEFDNQYHFEISEQDRVLLHGYTPLTIDTVEQDMQAGLDFFAQIDNQIDQCKFCPEIYTYGPIIFSDRKKHWIKESK